MARLMERYEKEIVGRLGDKLGRKNKHSLPRLQKIVLNMKTQHVTQNQRPATRLVAYRNKLPKAALEMNTALGDPRRFHQLAGQRREPSEDELIDFRRRFCRAFLSHQRNAKPTQDDCRQAENCDDDPL